LRAYIIVDLGFGDCGKGLLTDFLARQLEAEVVVRYNGGAQAGHNVVTPDGQHHTFSQFGSGTFMPHVKTFLSRHVVIHPTALLLEGDLLARKGVVDPFSRLRVSDRALVITPFHQAANRIRESIRGADRHGSCGVGVGEAVEDGLINPDHCVLACDLNKPPSLRRKLRTIREWKRGQLASLIKNTSHNDLVAQEYEIFQNDDIIDIWISSIARISDLGLIVPDSFLERWLHHAENVVFEGAQGVLLDADAGFHPYTTWSNCTAANAFELIQEVAPTAPAYQIGVMRSYAVRHGPGPLPTETDTFNSLISEHNQKNDWQGTVRYGWFDSVLARYALHMAGKIDTLAVTHLDILSQMNTWTYCPGYQDYHMPNTLSVKTAISHGVLESFHLPDDLSLEKRAEFTDALGSVTPVLETCEPDTETVVQKIESLVGQQIGIVSHGPSANNVEILHTLPS
jgi:adenylosuccinate synthase